jgi:putative DNA primase/helicase
MQGAWFVEVAELSVFAKRDIESLKSFISNPSDFTRFAFIRNDKTFKRQSVFVGTINPESNGYLMDTTGNRRFLPVKLNNICPEKVPEIRDQLFAEAYQMFLRGVPIHVSNDEMISIISGEQKSREFHDDWSTIILNYININRFDTSNMMTACEIYEKALKGEIKHYDQRTARRIANIMRRLGCGDPVHTTLNGIGGKYFDVSSLITKDTHTGITQWTE